MMRALIRNRLNRATRILIAVALCLVAALVLVSLAKIESQVQGIEQFAVSDAR
ncbi:hypothetical protein AEGHOMDF_1140 [Methylobacterium soli]|nr:hypothetical protein AEGHOMDF_1140 [Methylobacterium soli]